MTVVFIIYIDLEGSSHKALAIYSTTDLQKVYVIEFINNSHPPTSVFVNPQGEWEEEGKGITVMSNAVGKAINLWREE